MKELFRIGQIVGAHGIRGAVKIYPTTEEPERFLELKTVLLAREGEEETEAAPYEVLSASLYKNGVRAFLKGVDDRDAAERLIGQSLWVERGDALPLKENEYYIRDLIGCRVFDEEGADCGQVSDVLATGSNDVLVVTAPSGNETLLPMIRECVLQVDTEKKKILIHWMKGLRP